MRPTVKIGLVAPFEGRYRYIGYDVIYAVRLALDEANAAGGVGGYSVELVAYDDGADADQAVEQARKLVVDPEVVAAIGHFREDTTLAALSIYAQAGLPLVAPGVLDPSLTTLAPAAYRLGPPAEALAGELLRRLAAHCLAARGAGRIALVGTEGPLGQPLNRQAPTYGLEVAAQIPLSSADWLERALSADADAIVCDATPVTAGETVRVLREAGWEGAILGGPELAAADFAAIAGEAARATGYVTPWPDPLAVPGGEVFVAAYRKVSNGVAPGPLALPAYEATQVLLEALQRDLAANSTPTRLGMAETLATTDHTGLLGRIVFDASRNWHDVPLYYVERE